MSGRTFFHRLGATNMRMTLNFWIILLISLLPFWASYQGQTLARTVFNSTLCQGNVTHREYIQHYSSADKWMRAYKAPLDPSTALGGFFGKTYSEASVFIIRRGMKLKKKWRDRRPLFSWQRMRTANGAIENFDHLFHRKILLEGNLKEKAQQMSLQYW